MWQLAFRRCEICGKLFKYGKMKTVCGLLCMCDKKTPRFKAELWGHDPTKTRLQLVYQQDNLNVAEILQVLNRLEKPYITDFVKLFHRRTVDMSYHFITDLAFYKKWGAKRCGMPQDEIDKIKTSFMPGDDK